MFDRQYMSIEEAHNPKLRPLHFRGSVDKAMDTLESFFKDSEFIDISRNDSFHEITASKYPFEITFILVPEENMMFSISVLAYTERFGGGAKRIIKAINEDIKKLFEEK